MKKFSRKFFALFSACVISVACALPAFAAQTDISNHGNNILTPGKILKILVETDLNAIKYYSQFPDSLGQYEQDFTNGGMLAVNPDLEALDHVFCVIDVTATTLNPQNQYFGKVLRLSAADGSNVTGRQRSIQNIDVLRAAVAINSQYVKTAWGDIYLIPLYFLTDSSGNLHMICQINNVLGRSVLFQGVRNLSVFANGKTVAVANPAPLEEPVTLAPVSKDRNSTRSRVENGYPTSMLLDITFPAGTYDNSVPVSEWKDVSFSCELAYTEI